MQLHRKRQQKKQLVSTLIIMLLVNIANAADPTQKQAAVTIETAKVKERSVPVSLTSIGTLYSQESTELSFGGEGHLIDIRFSEGAAVKQGDIIAVLDSRSASAHLASTNARLLQAESDYKRYQLVKDKNVFSEQEQVSIKTALEEAKADKKVALSALENLQLKAPYDGVLGSYQYDLGTFISTGTPLIRLVDVVNLEVKYSLEQQERNKVKTGQTIELATTAVPNHIFKGSVTFIAPTVDPSTGRFNLKAKVSNKEKLLAPGFSSNVRHFLGTQRQILVIPQTAIVADGNNYFVFRLTPDSHAERIMITIDNNTNDGFTEIKTGLKQGDTVATAGKERLQNGTLTTIIPDTRKPTASTITTSQQKGQQE